MITKEDLEFVRSYAKRRKRLDDELDRIRDRVSVHSVRYDKIMAKGGPERDRMAEHAAAIDEAERRWIENNIEEDKRYFRICEEIRNLPEPEHSVLSYRYIEMHSWKWICRNMHYSKTALFSIQKRALRRWEDADGSV